MSPKIYVIHATQGFDYQAKLYQPLRESRLNTQYWFVLPHEQSGPVKSSKHFIQDVPEEGGCDWVLAEVSYPSTGSGIELGWADAAGKPIICVSQIGSQPSSSLSVISKVHLQYLNEKDLIDQLSQLLSVGGFV